MREKTAPGPSASRVAPYGPVQGRDPARPPLPRNAAQPPLGPRHTSFTAAASACAGPPAGPAAPWTRPGPPSSRRAPCTPPRLRPASGPSPPLPAPAPHQPRSTSTIAAACQVAPGQRYRGLPWVVLPQSDAVGSAYSVSGLRTIVMYGLGKECRWMRDVRLQFIRLCDNCNTIKDR